MKAKFQKSERFLTMWIQKDVCKCLSQKKFPETSQKCEFYYGILLD